MANLLSLDASQWMFFILILIRSLGIISTAPIYGSLNIPIQVKIGLSLIIALLIQPFIPPYLVQLDKLNVYLVLVAQELSIGLVLGMVGRFFFAIIHFAGELAGFLMGFSVASVFDPQTQQQISIISQFQNIIATLVFLLFDAHHQVIEAIIYSYEVIGPGKVILAQPLFAEIIKLTADVFTIGLQIGAPLVVSMMVANISLGLLSRAVPQINIYVVSFILPILMGLIFIFYSMPFFVHSVRVLFEHFDKELFQIINLLVNKT